MKWTGEGFKGASGQQAVNQPHSWTSWRGRGQGTKVAERLLLGKEGRGLGGDAEGTSGGGWKSLPSDLGSSYKEVHLRITH